MINRISIAHISNDYNNQRLFIGLFLFISSLLINPIIVIIIGAFFEINFKIDKSINYLIAFSIALSISNREIGNSWYSIFGARADDDAINYLNYYHDFELKSYLFNFSDYLPNLLIGKEPLWFIISEITGFIFSFNDFPLVFVSVAIPVFIIHRTFALISPFFCFNALLFYVLVPEVFHSLYHLWRFSLSSSIMNFAFVYSLVKQKIPFKFLILGVFSHITSLIMLIPFFFSKFEIRKNEINNINYKILFIFLQLSIYFFLIFSLLFLFKFIQLDKILFYFGSESDLGFTFSIRHIIYSFISLFLIYRLKNRYVVSLSILNLLFIFLPLFYSQIGLIMERVLIITTPVTPLILAIFLKDFSQSRKYIIFPLIFLYVYYAFKLDGTLFYQFISNGNFFSPINGIIYNLFNHI